MGLWRCMGLLSAGPPFTLLTYFERMPCGLIELHGSTFCGPSPHLFLQLGREPCGLMRVYGSAFCQPSSHLSFYIYGKGWLCEPMGVGWMHVRAFSTHLSHYQGQCRSDHVGLWGLDGCIVRALSPHSFCLGSYCLLRTYLFYSVLFLFFT